MNIDRKKRNWEYLRALEMEFPLILAGMGGVSGPQLTAAVCNSGGAGTLGAYKLFDTALVNAINETKKLTGKPFSVNFIPEVVGSKKLVEQLATVLKVTAKTTFNFFGLPPKEGTTLLNNCKRIFSVQIGTLEEAQRARDLGASALILQGTEAGGHLLGVHERDSLTKIVTQVIQDLPIFVSGGISCGEDLAKNQALGADGVMCGTMFIAAKESDAHRSYKKHIIAAHAADTVITDTFYIGWPGRRHRVLKNKTVLQGKSLKASFIGETCIQGEKFLIPRFSAAVPTVSTTGEVDEMALYCGKSCENVTEIESVISIMNRFKAEYYRALKFNAPVDD